MNNTQHRLMAVFCSFAGLSAVVAVLCESGLLPEGVLKTADGSVEFAAVVTMELLSICVIPVALRLFKWKAVARRVATPEGLLRMGMARLLMLCVPMLANTVLYYLYVNVAFGYLAIILFLCMAFVLPTKERCAAEMADGADENKQQ